MPDETFTNADGQTIDERKAQIAQQQQDQDNARLSDLIASNYKRMFAHPVAGPLAAQLNALRGQYLSMGGDIQETASNRAVAAGLANLILPFIDSVSQLPGI